MIGYPFSNDCVSLGFGCAWLSGGRRLKASLRLLETAYDAGIRYYDVARMYMSGEAEKVLGNFQENYHNDIIITSKAGINPLARNRLERLVRKTIKIVRTQNVKCQPWRDNYEFGAFDIASLRRSIEISLRALQKDHIDALLLHEVDEPDLADGSVMQLLEDLSKEGKIRYYGFASTRAQTKRLIVNYGKNVSIIQTASTIFESGLAPLINRGKYLTVTHSVLADALENIVQRLQGDLEFRTHWKMLTEVDPENREHIAELLLAEALDANKNGIVLFSTSKPERIMRATRVANDKIYSVEQIAGLRKIIAGISAT